VQGGEEKKKKKNNIAVPQERKSEGSEKGGTPTLGKGWVDLARHGGSDKKKAFIGGGLLKNPKRVSMPKKGREKKPEIPPSTLWPWVLRGERSKKKKGILPHWCPAQKSTSTGLGEEDAKRNKKPPSQPKNV